ncbi:GAF domain-containing protein [Wenyingzhuangia sp. IMCC45467]
MYILKSPLVNKELPIKVHISFDSIFEYLENQAKNSDSIFHESAIKLLDELKDYPILKEGFTDLSLLKTYENQIKRLLSILFPDLLQSNEIKAASIPFDMTSFMLSKRFRDIIDNAGNDFKYEIRNFDTKNMYILTCVYILSFYYNEKVDFKRPFFYDIPDIKNNTIKSYRALYNADFAKIIKTDKAPELTKDDIKHLLNNFDNIDVWKEKLPPNSYIFKGFGMMNLFDVTQDETISNIKNIFIKRNFESLTSLQQHLRDLFNLPNLKMGVSIYNKNQEGRKVNFVKHKLDHSLIANEDCCNVQDYFCHEIKDRVFNDCLITSIADIDEYRKNSNENDFYKSINSKKIKSIILVPIKLNNNYMAVLELASSKSYALNSINANKLKDVLPVLSIAVERSIDERQNLLESVIQENYTTIHPSVKWKFYNAADEYLSNQHQHINTKLRNISFKNVYPLYGQCDVKDSSAARNKAIQDDLSYQLKQTILLFEKIHQDEKLFIYDEIIFRLNKHLQSIKTGIKTTDELQITDFFKDDIYPVLNHIKQNNSFIHKEIVAYENEIDPNLNIVYKKRKAYEDFIISLNSSLAKHLDKAQKEAQEFYPHYYERFKTDGLDYNMYIGESISNTKEFHPIYIKNIKLWQLIQQCELEKIAKQIDIEHPEISLQVTSLILVHSQHLDIKFRMDEKKFDVDGAYNMRYEIIKKRIDKSYVKGTKERLTQTEKLVIVYTHEYDLEEYLKYIEYLTQQNYFIGEVEHVDIEDLQGVSGLKAIRVKINYNREQNDLLSFKNLLKATKLISEKN